MLTRGDSPGGNLIGGNFAGGNSPHPVKNWDKNLNTWDNELSYIRQKLASFYFLLYYYSFLLIQISSVTTFLRKDIKVNLCQNNQTKKQRKISPSSSVILKLEYLADHHLIIICLCTIVRQNTPTLNLIIASFL